MKILDHLEEWIIGFLMGASTLVIFVSVLHRYALGIPFFYDYLFAIDTSWAKELCIYMFIWMAKFGAAYGVRTGIHVGVDVLVNLLPDRPKRQTILLGLLGGVIFTLLVGSLGVHFVWKMAHTSQVSSDLEMPMWLVYLCVPLGSYLMCFRFMQVIVHFVKTGELPHHDHAVVDGLEVDDLEQEAALHPLEEDELDPVHAGGHK
ncbi:MAG: TRAP transporter small permease [Magnetococcales bacterium]|nr:TRAP transporter small permease [Magnetococcales bacterium]